MHPRETRCVAGMRCRAYQRDAGPALLYRNVPLCDACLAYAQTTIRQLKHDWLDLQQAIMRTSRAGEMVSGSRDAPIPIRVDVEAIQAEILHVLVTWETILRHRERLCARPGRVRPGYAVHRATDLLHLMAPIVAAIPATLVRPSGPTDEPQLLTGAQALLDLPRLHDRAMHALGLTDTVTELPGRCTSCGRASTDHRADTERGALTRLNGSDTVVCRHCGHRITYDEYTRYATAFGQAWRAR